MTIGAAVPVGLIPDKLTVIARQWPISPKSKRGPVYVGGD